MSIFTYFTKKRREQRRKLKELKAFASGFSTLDRLEQSGLLTFDAKQRRLFIAQSLAVLMMRDAESWVNFITNVYQWLYYQQAQEAWNAHFLKEELAAGRRGRKTPRVLRQQLRHFDRESDYPFRVTFRLSQEQLPARKIEVRRLRRPTFLRPQAAGVDEPEENRIRTAHRLVAGLGCGLAVYLPEERRKLGVGHDVRREFAGCGIQLVRKDVRLAAERADVILRLSD